MNKEDIINKYQTMDKDTGSSAVQISILTFGITKLQQHLESFRKDFHSRVGLMRKINKRRNLMHFLKTKDPVKYRNLIKDLRIRG